MIGALGACLGVSNDTVYKWIDKEGKLAMDRLWKFKKDEVDAWVKAGGAADFKTYIFPLLFFKRLSDVYDEEYAVALEESDGDVEFAQFPENNRFQVAKKHAPTADQTSSRQLSTGNKARRHCGSRWMVFSRCLKKHCPQMTQITIRFGKSA